MYLALCSWPDPHRGKGPRVLDCGRMLHTHLLERETHSVRGDDINITFILLSQLWSCLEGWEKVINIGLLYF